MEMFKEINSQGDESISNNGKNFYCGKIPDENNKYKCNTCDGRCGPTNGCNCFSCKILDEKYGIMDWHIRTYDYGDNIRNLEKQRLRDKKINFKQLKQEIRDKTELSLYKIAQEGNYCSPANKNSKTEGVMCSLCKDSLTFCCIRLNDECLCLECVMKLHITYFNPPKNDSISVKVYQSYMDWECPFCGSHPEEGTGVKDGGSRVCSNFKCRKTFHFCLATNKMSTTAPLFCCKNKNV